MDYQLSQSKKEIRGVVKSGYAPIEIRFQTLINASCEAPFDWYKDLGLDKSYASKIRRGLIIPPVWLRIKIAQYFKTDSSTIWRIQDLDYIKELIKTQKDPEQKPKNSGLPNHTAPKISSLGADNQEVNKKKVENE